MKNARLFAVAAAMGMFASTVTAAEVSKPKDVTKTATVVEISANEKIVRAEFGGKVVLPEITANAYSQSRTTKKPSNYSYPNQVNGKTVCYVGWTNEVGTDTNSDGMVDAPIYVLNSDGKADTGWFYDAAKSWPTDSEANTWAYYAGLFGAVDNKPVYSGRIIAPGAAAFEGWHLVKNHTNATGGNYTDIDKLIADLITNKVLVEVLDADGDVFGYRAAVENTYVDDNKVAENTIIASQAYFELNVDQIQGTKYARKLADLKNEVINVLSGGTFDTNVLASGENAKTYQSSVIFNAKFDDYGDIEKVKASYEIKTGVATASANYFVGNADSTSTTVATANVVHIASGANLNVDPSDSNSYVAKISTTNVENYGVLVVVDRNYKVTDVISAPVASIVALDAGTAGKYTDLSELQTKKYITIVQEYKTNVFEEIDAFKPEMYGNEELHGFVLDNTKDTEGFVRTMTNVETMTGFASALDANERIAAVGGLYQVDTPANKTDKYVFSYNMGVDLYKSTMDLKSLGHANATKKTFTVDDSHVYATADINGDLLPVFDTAADALEFLSYVSHYGIIKDDLASRITFKRTWLEGDVTSKYVAKNGLDGSRAVQCTFGTTDKTVTTNEVVITSNAASIDTNKYGVQQLTITGTVGDAKAETKVDVVIAPKYEREWANGKVTKLTARHLNGNVYAIYKYDYAKKTVTVNFYAQDGQTVVETATSPIV